jgi:hypothetical protein
MLVDYERNKIRHLVGTHTSLENALMRFPKVKPFDLVDTAYWSWHALSKNKSRATVRSAASVAPLPGSTRQVSLAGSPFGSAARMN